MMMMNAFCVDVNGAPSPRCAQLLAYQGATTLLMVLCMHRVFLLAAPRSVLVLEMVSPPSAMSRLATHVQVVLAAATSVVCAALLWMAAPLHSMAPIVISSALGVVTWGFYAAALGLQTTRMPAVSLATVVATGSCALLELLLLSDWTLPATTSSQPLHRISGALQWRAFLVCATAAMTTIIWVGSRPPLPFAMGKPRPASPFDYASRLSRFSFHWLAPIMQLSNQRRLEIEDVPPLPRQDETSTAAMRFKRALGKELRDACEPSFLRVLYQLYGGEIAVFALWSTANKCIGLASPLLLKLFLDWADESSPPIATGYSLAGLMIARSVIASVSGTQYSLAWQRFDLRVRAGLITAIYDRSLKLNAHARRRFGLGKITNLVSVDLGRLVGMPGTCFDMFLIPLEIVVALLLLAHEVSYAFIGGLVVLAVMLPLQTILGGQIQAVTKKMLEFRDERVGATAECLRSMRIIKLLAWINVYMDRIGSYRRHEIGRLRVRKYLDALCVFFWASTPVIVQTAVFTIVIFTGGDLTAANAFTAVALLDRLVYPMNYFPWIINGFLEARVSALRIRRFLFPSEEDQDTYDRLMGPIHPSLPFNSEKKYTVEVHDCVFTWSKNPIADDSNEPQEGSADPLLPEATPSLSMFQSPTFELHLSRFELQPNTTYMVCGSVGSGKSSLLLALLGEMPKQDGGRLFVDSTRISYAPQTPWLFRGSVRENITLCRDDTSIDDDHYQRVLRVCELDADLKRRKMYDKAMLSENGGNFSGGQKLRISLARALYQRSSLYLLDDPLSGLDSKTAQSLLQNCFRTDSTGGNFFPKGATILLVTHAIYLIDELPTNTEVVVVENGTVVEHLAYKDQKTQDDPSSQRFISMLNASKPPQGQAADGSSSGCTEASNLVHASTAEEKFDKREDESDEPSDLESDANEHRETGHIDFQVWKQYARSVGWPISIIILLSVVVMQISRNGLDWWIAHYTNGHAVAPHIFADVLLGIAVVNCVSVFFRSFLFAYGGLRAANKTYDALITSVFSASLGFFDATPVGRILNRLSGDTYAVDESLPFILNIFLKDAADVAGSIVILFYGNAMVLVLLIPLSFIYFRLQDSYRPTSRHVKRLDATTQSPILSMFAETLEGLNVIRAMRIEQQYHDMYEDYLNVSQRMSFLSANAGSWFGIRLDLLGVCVTSFVVLFAVVDFQLTGNVHPGVLGLTLTYALPIVSKLTAILGSFVATEREMIAVERVKEYSRIPSEESNEVTSDVPPTWPSRGEIQVKNLSVAYFVHDSEASASSRVVHALQNVSCSFNPGVRVGICGRTGAGKSTFLHALFRAVTWEPGSSVNIDGIAIDGLPLQVLRSRLTYVPQDIVLFTGSVRSNLDPEGLSQDHELWEALTRCNLDVAVSKLQHGLESMVETGEATFSKGQAQLFCIARALLRRSKVLCMDEATSSIDYDTEVTATKTLKEAFADATVIIIAHRLQTIMDCDRVLVFESGRVIESGQPNTLFADSSSHFSKLAKHGSLHEEIE